jgi:hypothetical protein
VGVCLGTGRSSHSHCKFNHAGVRVSVCLAKKANVVLSMLSVDAKPYVPPHWKTAFDRPADHFHAVPPPLRFLFRNRCATRPLVSTRER